MLVTIAHKLPPQIRKGWSAILRPRPEGRSRPWPRWGYGLLAAFVALTVWLGTPQASQAIDWLDWLRRGFEIYQLNNLSEEQEVSLGAQIDRQLRRQLPISNDDRLTDFLTRVGTRVAAASSRPGLPYQFRVVNSPEVNAFTTMGGFVYFNRGLLELASNEAEVAGVMGHEVGHLAARHVVQRLRSQALRQGILRATGLDRNRAVTLGVELALNRPGSRQDELEADQLGLAMLLQSGYAPIGLPEFLQKLTNRPSPPALLSTHPNAKERVDRLLTAISPNRASLGDGLNDAEYRAFLESTRR